MKLYIEWNHAKVSSYRGTYGFRPGSCVNGDDQVCYLQFSVNVCGIQMQTSESKEANALDFELTATNQCGGVIFHVFHLPL